MSVQDLFEEADDEYLKFDQIPESDRRNPLPDVCAMIYLHEKLGGKNDAIVSSEHDVIYLQWDEEECEKLTREDVIYLRRCGVRLGEYGLEMFT